MGLSDELAILYFRKSQGTHILQYREGMQRSPETKMQVYICINPELDDESSSVASSRDLSVGDTANLHLQGKYNNATYEVSSSSHSLFRRNLISLRRRVLCSGPPRQPSGQ